ncbi:MAG: ATP-dependent zinc metalloprotease FtsH [Nitrosopumilaceae archaeon]
MWGVIALLVFVLVGPLFSQGKDNRATNIPYSEFVTVVTNKGIARVQINNQTTEILFQTTDDKVGKTHNPETDNSELIGLLLDKGVVIDTAPIEKQGVLESIFISWFPMILLIGVWIFFMRQMQGGMGNLSGYGKSKARLLEENNITTTFADVAGVDEAVEEVGEIVEFLKNPGKFQKLGSKIPRGILMVGDAGVGKTLLARAIAGEAKVPFFTICGSDFVEMFVGVGASRVRNMFEQAKKAAPCIVFIDEIDAVGRHRGAGLGGGNDEREQTLNQLLVEMDGFEQNSGIIIIAATNRPDVLDPALLRPGRFDRHVVVPMPDRLGREKILKIHAAKVPTDGSVNFNVIARGTPGFTGADLGNLVNEAAIFAARVNKEIVSMSEFEKAKDKVMMGAERPSLVMDEQEKKMTAYHEAGHAIVGLTVPGSDPCYKVTIIPRGRALGITMFLPKDDRLSKSRQKMESMLATAYGGRIAEELIFGVEQVTAGAQNDIEKATEVARDMITKWGWSKKLGPLAYQQADSQPFFGKTGGRPQKSASEFTSHLIEEEMQNLVSIHYNIAKDILVSKIDILHNMAAALLSHETIDEKQLERLMAGEVIEDKPVIVMVADDKPQGVNLAPGTM